MAQKYEININNRFWKTKNIRR